MLTLREAMDRLFDESIIRPMSGFSALGLPVDIEARKDEYVVRVSVPGLQAEDMRIEVVDNTVTISGEFKAESQDEQENYLLRERRYGQFNRSFTLPTPLNPAKAEAEVENGVLTLRLPKAEEAKPKSITIRAK
jgi:HSP20 family protein